MTRHKFLCNLIIIPLYAVFVCFFSSNIVSAVEMTNNISIKQIIDTDSIYEDNETFSYNLIGLDKAPMPTNSSDQTYSFYISGNTTKSINILYSKTGIYHYELKQVIDDSVMNINYDERTIYVDVYVNLLNSSEFDITMVAKDQNGYKLSNIQFTNIYLSKNSNSEQNIDGNETLPKTNSDNSPYLTIIGFGFIIFVVLCIYYRIKNRRTN